jgi:bifunctional non-homologous end joining protein LigD
MTDSRHAITPTHADKVLFPRPTLTKARVLRYYRDVARWLLPHIRHRPLTLERHPEGIEAGGFMQQTRPDYVPDWLDEVTRRRASRGAIRHIVCNDRNALLYLVNQNTTTFHVALARDDAPDRPDRIVFDLDPSSRDFMPVIEAARDVASLCVRIGLAPRLMTTGSRGLHVIAAIRRGPGFDEVRALAAELAGHLARENPGRLTTEQRKSKRNGRLFLDVTRNALGQTTVAPYSLRALDGAPVATPIDWNELGKRVADARHYHLGNVLRRLGQKDDPWRDLKRHAAALDTARQRWRGLDER